MFSRSYILPFVLAIIAFSARSQDQRVFLDEALHPVEQTEAVFYAEIVGPDSGRIQARIMAMDGLLKAIGDFKEADMMTPDGYFTYYYPSGSVESEGNYVKGRKDGLWLRYDSAGQALAEKIYDSSVLDDLVFTQAQQMPSCPGGQRALVRQVQSRVGKLKGHPTALFVVEKDGTLSDIKVIGAASQE
ncbi:MAG: hypothetical protein ABI373_02110, partial [Flavobacteriales bacterium]